jgi:hypothetical protein
LPPFHGCLALESNHRRRMCRTGRTPLQGSLETPEQEGPVPGKVSREILSRSSCPSARSARRYSRLTPTLLGTSAEDDAPRFFPKSRKSNSLSSRTTVFRVSAPPLVPGDVGEQETIPMAHACRKLNWRVTDVKYRRTVEAVEEPLVVRLKGPTPYSVIPYFESDCYMISCGPRLCTDPLDRRVLGSPTVSAETGDHHGSVNSVISFSPYVRGSDAYPTAQTVQTVQTQTTEIANQHPPQAGCFRLLQISSHSSRRIHVHGQCTARTTRSGQASAQTLDETGWSLLPVAITGLTRSGTSLSPGRSCPKRKKTHAKRRAPSLVRGWLGGVGSSVRCVLARD